MDKDIFKRMKDLEKDIEILKEALELQRDFNIHMCIWIEQVTESIVGEDELKKEPVKNDVWEEIKTQIQTSHKA